MYFINIKIFHSYIRKISKIFTDKIYKTEPLIFFLVIIFYLHFNNYISFILVC